MNTDQKLKAYIALRFYAQISYLMSFAELVFFWYMKFTTLFWVMLVLNILGMFALGYKIGKLEKELF